jgi:Tfp pilus assembly protein FimT
VTVLELTVVVSLILVLAGTALFGYRAALSTFRLNGAARQVVLDLKVTRLRAMAESVDRRLHLPDQSRVYQPQEKGPAGSYADDGPPTWLPEGIRVVNCSGAGSSISFRPAGYAGAFGTIILANSDGAERRVVVDIAGRMRVQ